MRMKGLRRRREKAASCSKPSAFPRPRRTAVWRSGGRNIVSSSSSAAELSRPSQGRLAGFVWFRSFNQNSLDKARDGWRGMPGSELGDITPADGAGSEAGVRPSCSEKS